MTEASLVRLDNTDAEICFKMYNRVEIKKRDASPTLFESVMICHNSSIILNILGIFVGIGAGVSHDVPLVRSHAPRRPQLRQSESGERPLAAHRETRLLPGEHQPLDTGEEEEEARAEESGVADQEQHQPAVSVSTRDQRRRRRPVPILLPSDHGAAAERAGEFAGSEFLRQREATIGRLGFSFFDARSSVPPTF